jgi:RND family efflux transporter MFP subunit
MDAVFDVPAAILDRGSMETVLQVSLSQNPAISATGRVREVAPRADTVTGTFRVRVGLIDPPEALRLGSTVTGTTTFDAVSSIEIPATALTRGEGEPAVWVVDPASKEVSLRPVAVGRFTPTSVVVEGGLQPGDIVVTAGVQALRPGQVVRLPGAGA